MRNEALAQKLRSGKEPVLILICGMPGTRKSSTAIKVASALDFSVVVGMDEIRDVMLKYDRRPILAGKSHDRWQLFGIFNTRNFRRGFVGHCKALREGAMAVIGKNAALGENIIVEGVHLLPSLYSRICGYRVFHIVLAAADAVQHKKLLSKKFGRRHGIQQPWDAEKIQRTEMIQKIILSDAQKYPCCVVESTTPKKNAAEIIRRLSAWIAAG